MGIERGREKEREREREGERERERERERWQMGVAEERDVYSTLYFCVHNVVSYQFYFYKTETSTKFHCIFKLYSEAVLYRKSFQITVVLINKSNIMYLLCVRI